MIRVQDFACRVGGRDLLQDVSFALEAGQRVAIVGANGAGKSTLLRALSGELSAVHMSGELKVAGRALRDWPLAQLAQRRSFLMQSHSEALALPVHELVALGAFPHGGLRRDQQGLLDEALARWELLPLRERIYTALSGGERQRVQLVRSWLQIRLHENAAECIWMLDEPLNSLDLPHQQLVARQMREQAEAGALVLFSVHDINFALRAADTVLALNNGRLLYAGNPQGLAQPALLHDIFGTAFLCLNHPKDGLPLVLPE